MSRYNALCRVRRHVLAAFRYLCGLPCPPSLNPRSALRTWNLGVPWRLCIDHWSFLGCLGIFFPSGLVRLIQTSSDLNLFQGDQHTHAPSGELTPINTYSRLLTPING